MQSVYFMMKLLHLFILVFVFTTASAQTKIEGYVHDLATNALLKGTKVWLVIFDKIVADTVRYDTLYKKLTTTYTDSNGYYSFECLSANIYVVCVFHQTGVDK